MTTKNTQQVSSGIGFVGLLQLVFLFCKLAEVTAIQYWSWLWVLSPLWIYASLIGLLLILVLFAYICPGLFRRKSR